MTTIEPRLAAVRPRVHLCTGGVARLLEEEVAELLAAGRPVRIRLCGLPSSGRSTALAHLAAAFAHEPRLVLRDGNRVHGTDGVVEVATAPAAVPPVATGSAPQFVHWAIAPWSDDDCLEYLCTVHRPRAAVAYSRWLAYREDHGLHRWPGRCASVLDLLACEDVAVDAWQALREVVRRAAAESADVYRRVAMGRFVDRLTVPRPESELDAATAAVAWLQVDGAAALFAAEALLHLAAAERRFELSSLRWQRRLAVALHVVLQMEPELRRRLLERIACAEDGEQGLPMSLLAATEPGFRPPVQRLVGVKYAMLAFADLHGLQFVGDCSRVYLAGANLRGARLDGARLVGADLVGADAWGASWEGADAEKCRAARLVADGVHGDAVSFVGSGLVGARFVGASLRCANFAGARLHATDFTGADLSEADLSRTDLRRTILASAELAKAGLHGVVAEGVDWPGLSARGSDWRGAHLSGAILHRANLEAANLSDCKLAHADLQGANLYGADLTGASFHMGNARSGLVGSEIACEGSRTGFYTDESLDELALPEAVRTANLSGCDLRAATLDGVDLYRVDLRGARLDPATLEHARRCRAIVDPVPET